jgi:orotate phosphoribosyltransferase
LLRAFTVRKETKTHGTGNLIEGPFKQGDRVVIIEDVVTSGGSALQAIDAVRNAGGEIQAVLALVDREEGGCSTIENKGYLVIALTRISEILASTAASSAGPTFSDA